MKKTLLPYQAEILDKNKDKSSVALFMGMGTGKTVTSLEFKNISGCKKILIICLVSKLNDWKEELKSQCNIDGVILNKGSKKNIETVYYGMSNAFIINYESAWRCTELLKWVDRDTFILVDESHKMKSHTSKIGKFMEKLRTKTSHKIILTGTPQSKGYIDYYNQLKFVDILNYPYKMFTETFCEYEVQNFTGFPFRKLVAYKNTEILDKVIKDNCVFYERSVDDDMVPSQVDVKLPKPRQYNGFKKVRIHLDYVADSASKLFVSLRTLCSGFIGAHKVTNDKIVWLRDLLDELNDRVVIFYNFNGERDNIIELLTNLDIPYSEYNGRSKDLSNFKQNQNGVAVCQYISASTGLNDLVCSHICVMYSPPLNYIDYRQAQKRIDRIGQTVKPLYYNLYCEGTVEEQILRSIQSGVNFDEHMFEEYLKK